MHVRPSWKPTLEAALPYSVRVLQQAYRLIPGSREFYVEVPVEPPSTNHIYRKFHSKKTNKTGFALDPAVKAYRDMVAGACWGRSFPMRAVSAVIIGIESPRWITKEYKVGIKDGDNPTKAVFDALKFAIGYQDELIWEHFPFKIVSRRSATHIWMYELGDVVNGIGGLAV